MYQSSFVNGFELQKAASASRIVVPMVIGPFFFAELPIRLRWPSDSLQMDVRWVSSKAWMSASGMSAAGPPMRFRTASEGPQMGVRWAAGRLR